MTSAVDEYYIHYHAKNIDNSVISSFEAINKAQLLRDQLAKFKTRQLRKKFTLKTHLGSFIAAGQLLDGTLLEGISDMSFNPEGVELEGLDFSEATQEQISTILSMDIQDIHSLGDCQKAVTNFINSFPAAAQRSIQSYADTIINLIADDNDLVEKWGSNTSNMVISTILNRSKEGCFHIKRKTSQDGDWEPVYESVIHKLGTLARALPEMGSASGITNNTKMKIVHSSNPESKEGKISAKGEEEIAQELMKKIQNYMWYLSSKLLEVSHGLNKLKGLKLLGEVIHETGGDFQHTGNDRCEVLWKPDAETEKLMSCSTSGKNYLSGMMQNKTSKSDFGFYIGSDSVSGSIGFNAKNYKASFNPNLSSADYAIQSGTPMLTLMLREAQFSATQVYNAIQIGAAVDTNGEGPRLENIWNDFISQLRYKAVLSAIAGFEGAADESFFMAIGGKFFRMEDILQNLINTVSQEGSDSVLVREIGDSQNKQHGGLTRTPYVQINKKHWQKDTGDDTDSNTRSRLVIGDSLDLMHQTKLKVSIHLSELAALNNLAL